VPRNAKKLEKQRQKRLTIFMAINYIKSSKKISSRDATMYFGYSADHVAYLIRNGKINGKKIYTKEAWKVSKKDLLEYLEERNKKFSQKGFFGILNGIRYFFKKYLSLKEASAISGYAPDYIGYLVRQEKIRGKKVYFGASWVTTKDAVKKYLDGKPPRKYQKPVTLSFPFWKKEKYFSFKIAKSGIFAALLIVFLSGWVLANSNQNQNQFVNIYPSQIQNIPKDNQAWKNEKKAIGPANVEPKGTLEYFSELNSAVYGGGAGSLFLSSFNETEFDLEMQDFGEKIKKESEEKKEESPGDIQQPAAETVETEESVEEEKSAETGENSALEAGAGEENEFSEVEKQSGDFSEENPKQDNTQKEALESEDYSEAEEESEPEDLLLAEDGEKEQKQAEEDATREEEVQGEDLQPQNQSGVLSETQNQSQEQSFVPLPDAGEEQVSFLEKIKNLFGKSTAKAGELLNFKEASQKNLISAKIKISLASGVKSSDIIPIESQISAGSKQGGFWEKIKGAFGFFKKQAPQIAKAQKDAGSFEEDQPEPIALPATEGETGGQEEGMKEEEYAGEEEDGQEQPVEYTGELSQEDPKQEEEAEQLEQPESQGQEKESGEEKNLTADAGLGQEEIQLESEAEQEKKEKDEQAKDLEKEENQEKEENPQPKAQPQTDQELFEQSKEETILPNPDDKVIIWYSLDGEEWIKLYSLSQDYFSNNSNGGHLSLEAPFLNSWEDIENLQIKIEGAAGGDLASPVYLDSFWVEAEYNEEPLSEDFELVALKKDWAASEEPVFELRDLKEQKIGFAQKLFASAVSTFNGQEAETETQIKAALIGPSEKKRNLKEGKEFEKDKNSGGETIKISRPESFKPGLHTFKLSVEKYGKTYSLEQDFTWGVLVVNSNKSIYSPGEKAYLQMGVLDEEGNTVCDAELELEIIAPDGSKTILKTDGPGKFIAASQNPLEKIESEDFEEKDEQAEESFKEDSDKFNSAGQSVGLEESYVEPEEKEEQQEDSSSEEEIDFFQPEKADLDSSQEKDKDIEDAGILTEESQSQATADDNIDSENLLPVQEGEADAIEKFADIEAQEPLEGVQPPEENLQITEDVDSGYEVKAEEGDSMKKETLEESQNISDAEPEDLLSKIKKNISQNLLMGTAYAAPMDPPAFDEQGNEVYLPGLSGNLKKSLDSGEYLPASGGGDIYYSGKCGANNVVDVPDYFAYYDVGQKGEYKIKLTARTANGEYAIADSFEARDWVPFDIERIGPSRIFPPADYQMKLTIKANEDFKGEIVETVPANFQILNNKIQNIKFEESENVSNSNFRVLNISNKEKKLIWSNVVLKQGDTIEIDYAFNAPDISPYIYFLGPMGMEKLANTGVLVSDADGLAKPAERKSQIIFQEIRQWQIASDATGYDVKVQRNITDFGASEDSLAVNIDSVSATSSAFARLTDVVMKSGGLSAGSTATKNNDDVGASILLTATNQITVYRESTGENADYRTAWEVWEYTGSPGGANEFIVRYQDHITMASGQQDQTVSGISNINNCVPFVTGIRNTGVSVDFDDMTVTAEMYESEGTNYVRLKREGTGGTTYVSVAVVEFTGSNWTVQNNISHKFSAAAANETETINNVSDWTKAFIISSYRTGNGEEGLEEQGWNTWPKDSDEIYFRLRTGADNVSTKNYYVIANVIQNSELTVQHIDSITGSGTEHPAGSTAPQTVNETINTVASTTATGLFSTHDCTGSATAFPRPMWNYYLSAADNVQYWRSFYGQPGDWALQVIQFPEATSSGTSSITVSGTVFTDEGSTTSTVGSVINLAIDGVWTASTTASTTDGSYTLDTGTATMATGTVLTIYTSNAAELGNTVTRYSGSGDVAGLDIYQNHIIVRHEDSGPITIADLDKYDQSNNEYILYTASSTPATLTASSTAAFYVMTAKTFQTGGAGGAVSIADLENYGTFTATSTQTISVSDSWYNLGTFNSASSNVQFISNETGSEVLSGGSPFYDLTFNGSGGEWTFQDAATTTNDLTITAGTASSSNNMSVLGGDVTGNGTLNWTAGTFLVDGEGSFGGTTGWTFYNLTFGDGSGTATTTNTASGATTTISNYLTIASNQILNAGGSIFDIQGYSTTSVPFIINGTFIAQTSTIAFTTDQDTNIPQASYYNLHLIDPPRGESVFERKNLNTNIFANGDGTFTGQFHIGHINYKSKGEDQFKKIDTTLIPNNYGWEMRAANYQLELPKYADGVFSFINTFIFDPKTLEEQNFPEEKIGFKAVDVGHIEGQLITDENDSWNNKKLIYPNAFAEGIDLVIQARNEGFDKLVVIHNKPENLDQDLNFKFEIISDGGLNFQSSLDLELGGVGNSFTWDGSEPLTTSQSLIIEKLKKSWFRDFKIWDSGDLRESISVIISQEQGKIYLTKIINKEFLEEANYPVFTDDTMSYYAGEGDGYVKKGYSAGWDAVHNATAGTADYTDSLEPIYVGESQAQVGYYQIYRVFYPIDTSGLDDLATLNSATFYFWMVSRQGNDNDGKDYLTLVQTSQESNTSLTANDFNNCGSTHDAIEGIDSGDRIDISDLSATPERYLSFDLNSGGIEWVSLDGYTLLGMRQGHDIEDHVIINDTNNYVVTTFSEYAGSQDPYLEVTYTVPTTYTLGTTTGQIFTIDNDLIIGNASDTMAVTAATYNPTIDVNGNVTITANSTFISPTSSSFTVAGNWSNTGTFTHSSSTVTFDGSGTSTFSGATTFYNLFSNTASKTLEFTTTTAASTTVEGTLTLNGSACGTMMKLRSTNPGTEWFLNVTGTSTVDYVDVQDSNATGSTETITATNSTDSGNNTKWSLTGDSCEMYPKINTLIDNFNDNSFDEEKWIRTNSTQVLEQNQELELSTILSGNYVAIDSTGYYDLTDSFALVEWIASGNNSLSSYEAYPLQLFVDSANGLSILNSAGTVYYSKRVGNVNTNLAIEEYSSISHRWLKILESGGTVYFSRSADGIIWNNVASTSTASLSFGIDSMYAEISAGTWQEESATTTMIIDNFNATPSEKVSDNFDDNSINGSIWTIQEGTGTVIENGQKIILTPAPNTDGSSPILYTSGNYDLTNSSVYVNVKQVCNSNIKTTFDFILGNDYDNRFYIDHYNGDLEFYKVISGSSSLVASIAYNDSAMSWWRVRGSGGIIYGEYSANGSDWYELGNFSDSFGADYMRIILETYEIGSVDSPGEAWFDNFNTIGATVSGTVFTDEGSTTSTVGSVINLAIDGVWTASTTVSTMDGSYAFVGVSQPATSTVLTVYTSNAAELGNTVTRYLGSGDVAGLDIYQNHIIVRHEDDGPITITDLDQYDTDDDATYMLYTANAGAGTLTVNSTSTEFFVWTGDTFSVGDVSGAISLAGVDINGTFIATSTQTISVSGDWDATGGTFTSASSTVQFTATTTGKTITVNENPFYNLTFNGSGGEWTFQDAATTTNDLTITAGTALSSYDMAVQGGDVTGDGVLYWTGTSSFLVRGTGNFGGSTLWRFYDLIFGDGNEATTTNPGSDYILIGNSLTIASNQTLNAGSATWDLAGQGTPFTVNGTFNSQTSVLYYSSAWDANIAATNYYDLKLQPYLAFSDDFETGNLSLWDGAFTSSGSILEASSTQAYAGTYSMGFKVGGEDGYAKVEEDYLGQAKTSIVDFYLYIPSDFDWGTASGINIMGFTDNSWNDRFSMLIEDWGNIRLTYTYWDSIGSSHWTDGGTYLSKDHWYHIKGEDYVDSSNGYIKIWIDDALFVNNTGINTGSTSIDNIYGGSTWADGSHSLLYEDNIVFYNVPTYTLGTTGGQNITVNHDFILGNGTDGVHLDSAAQNPSIDVNGSVLISTSSALIAPTSSSFAVAGNWTNFGTFTHSSSTVTFDADSTGKTIDAGNSSFYNVVFDNISGGWIVANDTTSTNNWSITNAAAFELSASKTIEVGGQYSIGNSVPSITTWNSDSVLYLNNGNSYTIGSKSQDQEVYSGLKIGENSDIRIWNSSSSSYTVDASGSLYSMDHNNADGSAYIWGDFHTNANDYLSYANDFDGTPGANRQCQLTLASGAAITIDNGDNLEIKGGGTSSDDITTVSYAPASGSWNFNNNSGSETIIQEASLGYIDFVNGTTTVINTILNNETVTSTGVLNVDWYLGAHLVDKDNESGNVDTDGEGITISEASSTAVIYQHSGSAWIGPVSSTTTDSGADGKNPQPNSSLAIRIREYQKTAAETTYYKYNLAVSSGAGFSAYNYFNDYGSSYITSASSSESLGVDKCISESWQRDAIGAMNTPYSSVNEMPENGSWYVGMASDLQFSIDSASVNLGTLSAGNNWTGTGATILSATTSYPGGYSITAYASNDGRLRLGATGNYINRWDYANSTPALWGTNCEDNDSYCGFGYTTNDTTLGGTGDANRFTDATKYAGFATTAPGDIVGDSTTTAFGATTTITYKVSAKSEYADGEYNTTVYYLCTVNY